MASSSVDFDWAMQNAANFVAMAEDPAVKAALTTLEQAIVKYRYSYNFTWLGRPIIQIPQDIVAIQEIIWETRPELIIETGVAHGGSLILSASILRLLGDTGRVIGIDVDIRQHNRAAIEAHPLAPLITLIQGSSIDEVLIAQIRELARDKRTMVVLDSDHSGTHVAAELQAYSSLVTPGCYLCVMDTICDRISTESFANPSWGPANNPMTAVQDFIKQSDDFEMDTIIDQKFALSVAPRGYLKRK